MKKRLAAVFCISCFLSGLTGCNDAEMVWNPMTDNVIKIAVTGDDEFYNNGQAIEGMELAAEDLLSETGVDIEIVTFDDDADYHKAIAYANKIAADSSIAAVIIKQEIDFVDVIADIYEKAQKPFIITNGCYNHTIENGYEYLIADFINAKIAGSIMAQYIIENDFRSVAFCHSDTEYEEDELKGMQAELSGSSVVLADTVVGPFTQEEFDIAYARWVSLGVDVVCVSNYFCYNSDLVRMLREKGSDIQVVSDYVMETEEDIALNGEYLDGTVIVPLYITGNTQAGKSVSERFRKTYGRDMLEDAAQCYDLVMILGNAFISGVNSPEEFMAEVKSEDGHEGLNGKVMFDENGALVPTGYDTLVFYDGTFRMKE